MAFRFARSGIIAQNSPRHERQVRSRSAGASRPPQIPSRGLVRSVRAPIWSECPKERKAHGSCPAHPPKGGFLGVPPDPRERGAAPIQGLRAGSFETPSSRHIFVGKGEKQTVRVPLTRPKGGLPGVPPRPRQSPEASGLWEPRQGHQPPVTRACRESCLNPNPPKEGVGLAS